MPQREVCLCPAVIEEELSLRILLVTGSFPPMQCGVGDYSNNLANALAAIPGFEIGVLTSASAIEQSDAGITTIFPVMKAWRISDILKVVSIIRRWRPDIVHIQYPTQGYGEAILPEILPIIAWLMGKKVVQTWHERYRRRMAPLLLMRSIVPGKLVVVRPQYREGLAASLRWIVSRKALAFVKNSSNIPRVALDADKIAMLKSSFLRDQKRLITYLGFIAPEKGVDLLFDIADPVSDHIVIAGKTMEMGKGKITEDGQSYLTQVMERASEPAWQDKVTFAGFIPRSDAAELLAVADAVVLPFQTGGGEWNTSIHAAVQQGTFVLTTSINRNGYDEKYNVYYAKIGDAAEMRRALEAYAGRRRKYDAAIDRDDWRFIADEHGDIYRSALRK